MLALAAPVALSYAPAVPLARSGPAISMMETKADLEAMAKELNPVIGFWDPLGLADADFWGEGNAATIGFLRHAELKHGRVAMAAFVGYCVHATGKTFPWPMSGGGFGGEIPGQLYIEGSHLVPNPSWFPAVNGGGWPELVNGDVPALWDELSNPAKQQIFFAIFFLELWGEGAARVSGGAHYMREGGKPGFYPPFNGPAADVLPHKVPLDLWDPFGFTKKMSPEKKAKARLTEINNGRLAMIGIFGFLAESKYEGAVPALKGVIPHSDAASIAMQPMGCAEPAFGCVGEFAGWGM